MNKLRSGMLLLALAGITSCAQLPDEYPVNPDRMRSDAPQYQENEQATEANELAERGFSRLDTLGSDASTITNDEDPSLQFPTNDSHQVTANELPLRALVQSVFGESLQRNYVIAAGADVSKPVTMNVSEPVSSRRLFSLTRQLLIDNGMSISYRDETFYIYPTDADARGNVVIGLGRRVRDVPETVQNILQVIPVRYGIKTSFERTLKGLTSARITADFEQNALFVQGSRNEILRVIDLVSLLDAPSTRGRFIGLAELTFITAEDYIDQLTELMTAEGITAGTNPQTGVALLMVGMDQAGSVALFASDEEVLNRAQYWTKKLDEPSKGTDKRYYMYHPRYARASDLGRSVAALLTGNAGGAGGNQARDTQSGTAGNRTGAEGSGGTISAGNEEVRMTVDERSNTLVFYSTGTDYQAILPVVKRLDIMPKQILLDATIAEVTMTDEFAQGFEFAIRDGKVGASTLGALGVTEMGGLRLDWADGLKSAIARLSASTGLVNVLSNPTLVVRDGVSASINVGNDIPTVGATITNPNFESQTTNVVYRKTGVTLTVTPTINAQGLVILEIDQNISNQSDSGPSLQGSPSVFERSIKTEVIAQSGQTILLGGLISESSSDGNTNVPGFSDIPLIGELFKGKDRSTEKTELVIFITPRIIDSVDQWSEIRRTIADSLTSIKLSD
ncbi:secretin N-terminal domain-containing protein [Pseudidiomarina aestuarii]|nr:secretin N-terminal domain-containing protein [Pseudidiomarina aestuarii]